MKRIQRSDSEWRRLLADCNARPEGMSITSWCERQGISTSSFEYWRRKLTNKTAPKDSAFVQIPQPDLLQSNPCKSSEISIRYQDFEIIVPEHSSQELLARLLAAVRSSC